MTSNWMKVKKLNRQTRSSRPRGTRHVRTPPPYAHAELGFGCRRCLQILLQKFGHLGKTIDAVGQFAELVTFVGIMHKGNGATIATDALYHLL